MIIFVNCYCVDKFLGWSYQPWILFCLSRNFFWKEQNFRNCSSDKEIQPFPSIEDLLFLLPSFYTLLKHVACLLIFSPTLRNLFASFSWDLQSYFRLSIVFWRRQDFYLHIFLIYRYSWVTMMNVWHWKKKAPNWGFMIWDLFAMKISSCIWLSFVV